MEDGNARIWYNLPVIRVEDYLDLRIRMTQTEDRFIFLEQQIHAHKIAIASLVEELARVSRETEARNAQPHQPQHRAAPKAQGRARPQGAQPA